MPVPLYDPVPPVAVTVTVDDPPWHKMAVAVAAAVSAAGSVMVIDAVAVQLLSSVTTKL